MNLGKVPPDWQGAVYEDYGTAFGWRWWEDYPEAQRQALKRLVEDIARRWGFPVDGEHVLGHYRVQGKRDLGARRSTCSGRRNGNPAPGGGVGGARSVDDLYCGSRSVHGTMCAGGKCRTG